MYLKENSLPKINVRKSLLETEKIRENKRRKKIRETELNYNFLWTVFTANLTICLYEVALALGLDNEPGALGPQADQQQQVAGHLSHLTLHTLHYYQQFSPYTHTHTHTIAHKILNVR